MQIRYKNRRLTVLFVFFFLIFFLYGNCIYLANSFQINTNHVEIKRNKKTNKIILHLVEHKNIQNKN